VKFLNLMREELESAEDLEVVVSLVEVPPETKLPIHFHPGEEFAFVLEGSFVLWQEGKPDLRVKAGDAAKVPLKQVHTVVTDAETAKILVFRVHKKGQPERILVEPNT
jgi:quercetin dioxygenase-like cupin family protein